MQLVATSLRGLLIIGLLMVPACSADGIPRVSVSGEVTLDGQALEQGAILFQPTGGGPSGGGTIIRGEFSIPANQGPSPGKYRVEIVSYRGTGRMVADPDRPGKTMERTRQVIPPRYNSRSELMADVSATGKNVFRFALQGQ